MRREASCRCRWGELEGECKVLLEGGVVIVRGAFRRRAALSSLREIAVDGERLTFCVGEEQVALQLGAAAAHTWAKAMAILPPPLAKKLGISKARRVLLLGEPESRELEEALEEAGAMDASEPDLIVACVSAVSEVDAAIDRSLAHGGIPVWIVYAKGKAAPIGETAVRDAMRGREFMDVKVTSVSARLTGLRFVRA